jgi:hypothetical protein
VAVCSADEWSRARGSYLKQHENRIATDLSGPAAHGMGRGGQGRGWVRRANV